MTTDVKQAVEENVTQAEQMPAAVAEATAAPGNGPNKASVIGQVKDVVKDVTERAEKSPVAAKMRQTVKETAESVQRSPVADLAHKVLLAGIGAAALAQDEIEDFVNRLVERGEIAETDGKKVLKDVMEKRKKLLSAQAQAPKKFASDLEKRVAEVLERMNIPTKDEIEALGAKITALTRQVDELKKSS